MSGVHTATGTRTLAGMHVHTSGGTKSVGFGRVRTPTGTDVFFQSLASGGGGATGTTPGITVSPTDVVGTINSSASALVISRGALVTVTGGVAPYTYAWVHVSGDPQTATAPTGASSSFSATLPPGGSADAVWKCTVTDAAGVAADSPQITVELANIGGSL